MPQQRRYYPAGFPLQLTTNSPDIIQAADASWGRWIAQHIREPIRISAVVSPPGDRAPRPSFRRCQHCFTIVSDRDNFAVADLQSLEACLFLSERTAMDHAWVRWYFLEAVAYVLLAQRYAVPVHAACVARNGSGVLLCGRSGAGKSTLSFASARAGWTFLSDDGTWLLPDREDSTAIGRPFQARFRSDAPRWFPELEGFPERVRPDGKVSREVLLDQLPAIRTARQCRVGGTVLLDRKAGNAPKLETIRPAEVVHLISEAAGSYGDEVDRQSRQTVRKLVHLPAYRLQYDSLEQGVELLSALQL